MSHSGKTSKTGNTSSTSASQTPLLPKKIVIANRGEIALRVLRACKELGVSTVAVHSTADRQQKHVLLADESLCIGPPSSSESYLNQLAIITAAEITDATFIHPGYGFLSENPDFIEQVERSGFTFIGPPSSAARLMGDKIAAVKKVKSLGLPTVPGSLGAVNNVDDAIQSAREIGFPVLLKAAGGGGGRGVQVVYDEAGLPEAYAQASTIVKSAFADKRIYLEKYLTDPRHIEVQVIADNFGNVIHLGDRDCSLQRSYQKVFEEAPAIDVPATLKDSILKRCIEVCKAVNYQGVGTFEFLYQDDHMYFIEMNTRVQVEHPVTEMITGIDIVKEQIRIAAGFPLSIKQKQVTFSGHAVECRINAEHPQTFRPSPGEVRIFHQPGGPGIRVDSHLYNGYVVPPYYDSLVAKIIAHGETRQIAINRMRTALDELIIDGIDSNLKLHQRLVRDPNILKGGVNIHYLEELIKDS